MGWNRVRKEGQEWAWLRSQEPGLEPSLSLGYRIRFQNSEESIKSKFKPGLPAR